jgi:hypothetical protein
MAKGAKFRELGESQGIRKVSQGDLGTTMATDAIEGMKGFFTGIKLFEFGMNIKPTVERPSLAVIQGSTITQKKPTKGSGLTIASGFFTTTIDSWRQQS